MSKYRRFATGILLLELCLIGICNIIIIRYGSSYTDKEYLVDVSRAAQEMREGTEAKDLDIGKYNALLSVEIFDPTEVCNEEYRIEDINGTWYRFCYQRQTDNPAVVIMNGMLAIMWVGSAIIFLLIGKKIIQPFGSMEYLATELAKGNLSVPVKAEKSKFFGRFLWGMDMLREKLELDKIRELELEKEKKTLVLSLSHDIRTPLSAIDLYTKALATDLYDKEEERQQAVAGISRNTEVINNYVEQIVEAAREDFLQMEVNNGEFYLSEVIRSLVCYYTEKLERIHTRFIVEEVPGCLVYGDENRMIEVGQKLLENAIKYGDGERIQVSFSEEEDHVLVSITNSGYTLLQEEMAHIFDSFYRGSNSENVRGSGLGLYICKELLHKMDGEIYAGTTKDNEFTVTIVLRKI